MVAMESIAPFLPPLLVDERSRHAAQHDAEGVEGQLGRVTRNVNSNTPCCSQPGTVTRLGCREGPSDGSVRGEGLDGAISLVEGALTEHSLHVGEGHLSAYKSSARSPALGRLKWMNLRPTIHCRSRRRRPRAMRRCRRGSEFEATQDRRRRKWEGVATWKRIERGVGDEREARKRRRGRKKGRGERSAPSKEKTLLRALLTKLGV